MERNSEFDFRPAPFWFLNHYLEKDEIKRQIRLMKEADISGFFIHPRAGLLTPYGSEKWFELVDYMIEEAEKVGLKAWLYDEDPFPSGIAGGRVIFDDLNHVAKGLKLVKLFPDKEGRVYGAVGKGKLLSAHALKLNAEGAILESLDITGAVGVVRPTYFKFTSESTYYAVMRDELSYEHPRAETFYPELYMEAFLGEGKWEVYAAIAEPCIIGDKFGFIPDNLDKECVKSFIELTHEKYFKASGDKFGNSVPGIFTDEPFTGGNIPWTESLEEVFEKEKGYSIRDKYFHLAASFGRESRKVRRDYWSVVNKLYRENFFAQIFEWCREKGLLMVGHVIAEEDPVAQVGRGGGALSYQEYFDIPGFDIITKNVGDRDYPTLLYGGKMISSAAHQQGKKQVLSECMACNAFNFGPEGMRKFANWLFAVGVTWLVPHGFFYSYDGYRKFDAGKSFFFQDNHYSEFGSFSRYVQRLGDKLSKAEHLSNICVLNPTGAFWEMMPVEQDKAEALRNQNYSLIRELLEMHIEFDIIDDAALMGCDIKDGSIACGNEKYNILVASRTPDLSGEYVESIESLKKAGVTILWYDTLGNGIEDIRNLSSIWTDIRGETENSGHENLISYKKKTEKEILVYVFNNSPTPGYFSMGQEPREYCSIYDADTDDYLYAGIEDGRVNFALGSYEAILFVFTDTKNSSGGIYAMPENISPVEYEHEKSPLWDYIPPSGCLSYIKYWNVAIKGNSLEKKYEKCQYGLMRELVGTELGYMKERFQRPVFDRVEEIPSIYPVEVVFSSSFTIEKDTAAKKNKIFMVVERETFNGDYKVYLNGTEVEKGQFLRRTVYDSYNYVYDATELVKSGENLMRIEFNCAGEFDGVKGLVYFMDLGDV